MKKFFICFCLTFIILCTAVSVYAADFQNGNLKLSIPDDLVDQLIIDVPENDGYGELFSVTEKKSVEIAEKQGLGWAGVGWLFSLERVSEEKLREMLCYDMFGSRVFAKDQNGDYYLYNGPTDVRMIRDDYTDPKNFEDWGALNEWAHTVPDSFIAGNEGLAPEKHGNTELDIMLARALYMGTEFTVSTTQFGPLEGHNFNGFDTYLKKLSENVKFEYLRDAEIPNGEYVELNFPDDGYRFDFFLLDGHENIIRQVWSDGSFELLYEAVYDDGETKASDVMLNFYQAIAQFRGLYDPNENNILGTFADNAAGRCSIEITAADEPGQYHIEIFWGSSAFQTAHWEMTGKRMQNDSGMLLYTDAKHTIITFTSENESSEEVVYENGKGSFTLQNANELVWNDANDHAADDLLFVKVK